MWSHWRILRYGAIDVFGKTRCGAVDAFIETWCGAVDAFRETQSGVVDWLTCSLTSRTQMCLFLYRKVANFGLFFQTLTSKWINPLHHGKICICYTNIHIIFISNYPLPVIIRQLNVKTCSAHQVLKVMNGNCQTTINNNTPGTRVGPRPNAGCKKQKKGPKIRFR